jgi:hypothetical protein
MILLIVPPLLQRAYVVKDGIGRPTVGVAWG